MPERIQLKRTKGWRMPPGARKVDRSTKWGNFFIVGGTHPVREGSCGGPVVGERRIADLAESLAAFRAFAGGGCGHYPDLAQLRGRDLACWCKPGAPCHADILLELANR